MNYQTGISLRKVVQKCNVHLKIIQLELNELEIQSKKKLVDTQRNSGLMGHQCFETGSLTSRQYSRTTRFGFVVNRSRRFAFIVDVSYIFGRKHSQPKHASSLDLLSFRDRSEMIERIPRKWKTSRSSIYEKKHGRCRPQHGGDRWEMLLHQDCRAVCYLTNQDPSSSNVETNGTNDHIFHTLLRTPLIRFLVVLVFYIR